MLCHFFSAVFKFLSNNLMDEEHLPQDPEERLKLVVFSFQVISCEAPNVTCDAINQANEVISQWQHSEYGRSDCVVLLQMDIGPNTLYLLLNAMQYFIRYGFESWGAENTENLGLLLKSVLAKSKGYGERVFDVALRTFCDYLIARDSLDEEFMQALDQPSLLHFWADLCLEATNGFWKKYRWISDNQVLPGKFLGTTLELLKENPMSIPWLQIFMSALKFYDDYDPFVLFLPKLLESVSDFEMIKLVIDLTPCFYEVGLKSENVELVNQILLFSVEYSRRMREMLIAGADECVYFFLFSFLSNVLLMDYFESSLSRCLEALHSVISEIFQCLTIFPVNDDIVYGVMKVLWDLLQNFVDQQEFEQNHPLEPLVSQFFEVCTTLLNNGADPDQFPDTLQSLSTAGDLFTRYCAQFLANPASITPGILTLVSCNCSQLPIEMICQFSDLVLAYPRVLPSTFRFIRVLPLNAMDQSYTQRFISVVLDSLGEYRPEASVSLLGLVQKVHKELTSLLPDLVVRLASVVTSGGLLESLPLIGSTIFLLGDCQDEGTFLDVCKTIMQFLLNNDVYQPGCTNSEQILAYLKVVHVLITYCPPVSDAPQQLRGFYNALVIEVLKSLGPMMFFACDEVCPYQRYLSEFISFVLQQQWLTNQSVIGEWLGQIFGRGIATWYYCSLLLFLPEIYTWPSIKGFLGQLHPENDPDFDMAAINLMFYVAKCGTFWELFKGGQLILFLCVDQERVVCQALGVVEVLLSKDVPDGFREWIFKFLYCSGFDLAFRQRGARSHLLSTLKYIAMGCNKEVLEQIVRECSPYRNAKDDQFIAAVIRCGPSVGTSRVQDRYFQLMLDSRPTHIRKLMLSTM